MVRVADPERRTEILKAARRVFQKRGYADARMADIAGKAGIAAGTLYLYFPSKEALVLALCDDYVTRLAEALLPHLAHPDAATAIAESVRAALTFAGEERDLLRLLGLELSLGSQIELVPAHDKMHELLTQALGGRMARGEIRRYQPEVLADLITGLMEWVSQAAVLRGEGDLQRYEETLIKMLQNALLPEAHPKLTAASAKKKNGR